MQINCSFGLSGCTNSFTYGTLQASELGVYIIAMRNVTIDEAVTIGRYRARITLAYVCSRISLHTSGVVVKREYELIAHSF